jgi:hypothetical protein
MSYARPDIVVSDPELLHVLYRIGQSQYNARVEVPEYFGYWEPNQFMTFSPTGPPYIPPGSPGSYVSTTPDLDAFCSNLVDIDCIETTVLDANMVQLLYLALIFDFMAFTAQTFRRVLKRKPSSPANLQAIRDIMIESLSTMKAHFDNDTMTVTLDIFKAIVLDSEPTPSERRPRRRGDPLFSPPPTRDDITPSKYTRYETHTAEATSPPASSPPDSSTSASPDDEESPVSASDSTHPDSDVRPTWPLRETCCRDNAPLVLSTYHRLRFRMFH